MPPAASVATAPPKPDPSGVVLLPGARFFVRRVGLAAGSDVSTQVELALEAMAPFPLDQLYYGCVVDPEQRHALVYAAYRRNFSAEEQTAWTAAHLVLPDFVVWAVAGPPSTGAGRLQWTDGHDRVVVTWDEASPLPASISCHLATAEGDAEIQRRTGVPPRQILSVEAPIQTGRLTKEGLPLRCGSAGGMLATDALVAADVRDKEVLALHQRTAARNRMVLRIFTAAAVGLAACLVLELAVAGGNLLLRKQQRALAARAPEISRIESAQNLATRLEKLSAEQLKPFEMLAAINAPRPASVAFVRVSTSGPLELEVEAQTTSPGDMRNYETALRKLAGVERVELRDPRMRGGQTTFSLAVTFKSGWLENGGGA